MARSSSHRAFAHCLLLSAVCLSQAPVTQAQAAQAPDASASTAAKRSPELFQAIGMGDTGAVKALLARGVDPNSQNTLGMSALQIAAMTGNLEVIRALLGAGAEVNHRSMFGTPLSFAAYDGHAEVMQLLLTKGANLASGRPDQLTTLMIASRAGNVPVIQELLKRKADVSASDNHGSTALSHAARNGKAEAVETLIQAGANVDAADVDGWTPLMHAAVNGHAEIVELLLKKGAKVNARDKQGRTALLLAANFGDHPAAVRALLKGGADPAAKDAQGRTARGLAEKRGYQETTALLQTMGAPKLAGSQGLRTPRQAAQLSLQRVEHAMQVFVKRSGCVSCHHEGMARFATGFAKSHGYAINVSFAKTQEQRIQGAFDGMLPLLKKALANPEETKNVPIVDVGDLAPTNGALMLGMDAHGAPRNETLSTAAMVLARTQTPEGDWRFGLVRTPIQSSFFTTTAMAVRALRAYAPEQYAAEVNERVGHAKRWFLTAPTKDTEDRVFRLLGLAWAGASTDERRKAMEELRSAQRPDGGWAQVAGAQSDAYATGSALFALNQGGELPATDPVYQRGVQFLLRTQQDDGTWYVYKRAIPANNYFDSEFPYGQSQYISHIAAAWASMALILADGAPQPPRTASR